MSMKKKKILLMTSDGESFEIDEAVASQSRTIAAFVEDDLTTNNGFPLAEVTSTVLIKVIKYCKKHAVSGDDGGCSSSSSSSSSEDDLKKWDAEFMETADQNTILDLLVAANYLNIRSLLDLTCKTVASMIAACKDENEVRQKFNIANDYTPEEEAEVRRENHWAFE